MPPAMDDALYDPFHSDQMIFGPIDLDDQPPQPFPWDDDVKPAYPFAALNHYEFAPAYDDLSSWINDPASPIGVPSPSDTSSSSFVPYDLQYTPASFAALHPLPRSLSPPTFDPAPARPRVHSVVSPRDMQPPAWAAALWDAPSAMRTHPLVSRPAVRHSPLPDSTLRQRVPTARRGSLSLFQSASAPSETAAPALNARAFSRRADSVSFPDDRDATVRRTSKKRAGDDEAPAPPPSRPADSRACACPIDSAYLTSF